jgi:hypothetical protein
MPFLDVFSFFQLPDTYELRSPYSADGFIELVKFIHNDIVKIPNDQRKIVADVGVVDDGEYYLLTLKWQSKGMALVTWATASAFVRDHPTEAGCEIVGYVELSPAMPLFGFILLLSAIAIYFLTGVGFIILVLAFILFTLATRGALKWRNTLFNQLWQMAMIVPEHQLPPDAESSFDDDINQLILGIKQGI